MAPLFLTKDWGEGGDRLAGTASPTQPAGEALRLTLDSARKKRRLALAGIFSRIASIWRGILKMYKLLQEIDAILLQSFKILYTMGIC
jgi:hypothetical protein